MSNLEEKINTIKQEGLKTLNAATTTSELEAAAVSYIGRKAELVSILRTIKDLPVEERGKVGKSANAAQVELNELYEKKKQVLETQEINIKLKSETLDVTLPGLPAIAGKINPYTTEINKMVDIFQLMGFEVFDPFLIDDDYHNFTSVNIPEGHPARDMWDTVRINDKLVLETHTSAMQNRIISRNTPPIRAIVPGKVFRHEPTDNRHEHSFMQLEGIYVDQGIKLSDLLGTMAEFLKHYFGRELNLKIQPTYFPFVEPGLEIMMECPVCKGKKEKTCTGCGGSGWMEVIPCGPINPFVIKEAGLDPEKYTGFAWGLGLERMIMVKYQLDDIRLFNSGRLDFINQF